MQQAPATASKLEASMQTHRLLICNHHAPPTSANAHPQLAPLRPIPRTAASIITPLSCRAPSRAVLTTGTTALLMTIATTATIDTPNDTMKDMMAGVKGARTTDTTMATPNAMTTDTTTATQRHRTARGEAATILLPPTRMNHITHDDVHIRLTLVALGRASRPEAKRRGKTPSSTTWAKLPSSLA